MYRISWSLWKRLLKDLFERQDLIIDKEAMRCNTCTHTGTASSNELNRANQSSEYQTMIGIRNDLEQARQSYGARGSRYIQVGSTSYATERQRLGARVSIQRLRTRWISHR